MDKQLLIYLLIALSVMITAMSAYGVLNPGGLVDRVNNVWVKNWGLPFAITVRLVMGVAMISVADSTRYPMAFIVLGWLALLAAVALPVMGKERVGRIIDAVSRQPATVMRLWCLFGVAFGLFIAWNVL